MAETHPTQVPPLRLTRSFEAPREAVFAAWTEPEELKRWFHPTGEFSTPVAEVDLRVGGTYRIGIKPPDRDALFVVTGTFKEVSPPERLVLTWSWEGTEMDVTGTVVTVEFRDRGGSTEVVLTHELLPTTEARKEHEWGWNGCLEQLTAVF